MASPSPVASPLRARLARLARRIAREPHWLVLLVAYLSAWYLPLSWIWHLTRPGEAPPDGMDGPISWNARWWLRAASPLSYQLLVPLGVILLAWRQRARLMELWHQSVRADAHQVGPRKPDPGRYGWLALGGALLLLAHMTHMMLAAVLGLQLIAVGLIRNLFGLPVLRGLAVPLLFWLTMTMPPETVPAKFEEKVMILSARTAATVLHLAHVPVNAEGWTLHFDDYAVGLTASSGGGALVTALTVFFLWQGLAYWRGAGALLLRVCVGALVGFLLNLVRVCALVRLRPMSESATDWLNDANPWLLFPVGLALSLGILALIGRVRRWGTSNLEINDLSRRVHRPMERALDVGDRVVGQAGKRLRTRNRPVERFLDRIESLIARPFRWLSRSNRSVEKLLRRLSRPRRRRR